ncbi:Hypothetical protein I5071_400 (plasmid) [Sandaracinus amylolyticus]|nr:Hypothetical protein I5071_400 [Sandaracinus amylolyticus]
MSLLRTLRRWSAAAARTTLLELGARYAGRERSACRRAHIAPALAHGRWRVSPADARAAVLSERPRSRRAVEDRCRGIMRSRDGLSRWNRCCWCGAASCRSPRARTESHCNRSPSPCATLLVPCLSSRHGLARRASSSSRSRRARVRRRDDGRGDRGRRCPGCGDERWRRLGRRGETWSMGLTRSMRGDSLDEETRSTQGRRPASDAGRDSGGPYAAGAVCVLGAIQSEPESCIGAAAPPGRARAPARARARGARGAISANARAAKRPLRPIRSLAGAVAPTRAHPHVRPGDLQVERLERGRLRRAGEERVSRAVRRRVRRVGGTWRAVCTDACARGDRGAPGELTAPPTTRRVTRRRRPRIAVAVRVRGMERRGNGGDA